MAASGMKTQPVAPQTNIIGGTMPPMPPGGYPDANQAGAIQKPGMPPSQQQTHTNTMGMPPTAMQPAPGEYSQWGDNPTQVPAPPPGGGVITPPPPMSGGNIGTGDPTAPGSYNPQEKNFYGGQQIAGADPSQADYGSVQNYADQAYEQARRNIDPQQEQSSRRMEQELINKGVDPSSPQGMAMLDQQARNFNDQDNSANFAALQFGQGIQNQMAQQEQQKAQLAGQMQQGLWGQELGAAGLDMQGHLGKMQAEVGHGANAASRYGADVGAQTAMYGIQQGAATAAAGQANQRYGWDLQNQLGMGQLDLARNQGEHGQLMDFLGYDMQVNQYQQQQQMIQDGLYNQNYASVPVPGMSAVNPYGTANTYLGAGNTKYVKGGGSATGKVGTG